MTAESLGLSVAESKSLLQALQEVVAEWQMNTYLDAQRHCPNCGNLRHRKGSHHLAFRTLFGTISVESPRLEQGPCQDHQTQSFSPLAVLLPEKTTPELLYLETKWAALASYGMTVKMFEDVLPLDDPSVCGIHHRDDQRQLSAAVVTMIRSCQGLLRRDRS